MVFEELVQILPGDVLLRFPAFFAVVGFNSVQESAHVFERDETDVVFPRRRRRHFLTELKATRLEFVLRDCPIFKRAACQVKEVPRFETNDEKKNTVTTTLKVVIIKKEYVYINIYVHNHQRKCAAVLVFEPGGRLQPTLLLERRLKLSRLASGFLAGHFCALGLG